MAGQGNLAGMPSADQSLRGRCACGAVSFEVTEPFATAGYCHCKRCQRRSGTMWSINAMVPAAGFRIVAGEERVRSWKPDDGIPKAFCAECGGHLYSDGGDFIGVRLGALDVDPGIRPEWHQWLESAPWWEAIPDDGLPRFERQRR
jgi:hypothetical protein